MPRLNGKVQCLLCNDIIESTYRHDYKTCSCGNAMVDGGSDYLRYGWSKPDSVVVLQHPDNGRTEEEEELDDGYA